MIHFERTLEINATPDEIWAVLSRFMHIDEFAPEVKSVDALTKGEIGIGSKRRNNFNNGASLVEEVTDWDASHWYHRVEMLEMESMPLMKAYADIKVKPINNGKTLVTWGMDYQVKYGPVGWLMGQTMMKMMMGGVLDGNLKGLADKITSNRLAPA